jgi:hypothetical protein
VLDAFARFGPERGVLRHLPDDVYAPDTFAGPEGAPREHTQPLDARGAHLDVWCPCVQRVLDMQKGWLR